MTGGGSTITRTEGEIHINKRDLDLKAGDNEAYDSYGDAQGRRRTGGCGSTACSRRKICAPGWKDRESCTRKMISLPWPPPIKMEMVPSWPARKHLAEHTAAMKAGG